MEKMTMQTNKKAFSFLILSALTFLLAACPAPQKPVEVVPKHDSTKHYSSSMSKRFQDTAPKGQTAVDSAIELAKRHRKLSEETFTLRQKIQDLIAENHRLKDRLAILEPELKQTEKELAEANDLLIDMTTELNNWKMQILGFQDEMRNADIAQMEILLKIAQAMGAEVIPEQKWTKQSTETLTSGEPID
jgi:septal ring factor EnvC (AmiA/AmiB activator)